MPSVLKQYKTDEITPGFTTGGTLPSFQKFYINNKMDFICVHPWNFVHRFAVVVQNNDIGMNLTLNKTPALISSLIFETTWKECQSDVRSFTILHLAL